MTPKEGEALFVFDVIIAISIPIFVAFLYSTGRVSRAIWYMFWAGVLIGSTWELGFYFLGPYYSSSPIYVLHTPTPFPLIFLPLLHTLWDGGLFLVGVGLVYLICKPPQLTRFRWSELTVMLTWGVLSELVVELVATYSRLWEYQGKWWNPILFKFNDQNITLIPQLVWVVAPIIFYLVSLALNRRFGSRPRYTTTS